MSVDSQEWQAPPPPASEVAEIEPPRMSEAATLGNIFFDPGETFEDLRRKPRFIFALIIILVISTAFQFVFVSRMGEERFRRSMIEQMDKNPQTQNASPEQRQQGIEMGMKISGFVRYLIPVFIVVFFLIGSLLYWLGTKAMGGSMSFMQGVSAYIYSSFPPTVVMMLANFLILFLKSPDDIDILASQRGLVQANPSFFIDGKSMPALATMLSTIDLFQIWGWILAAIALRKMGKLSAGSAWAIVLIIALVGIAFRVFQAYMSGNPS